MKKLIREITSNPYFKKYQVFIFPIFSIICLGLAIFYIVLPQSLKFVEVNKKIEEDTVLLEGLRTKVDVLKKIDINKYKEDLDTTYIALPEDKNISSAIALILALLSKNNLQIQDASYTDLSADGEPTKNFRLKIDASGVKDDVVSFISQLAESPRLMRVTGVEYLGNNKDDQASTSITFIAFFEAGAGTLGAVEDKVTPVNENDRKILDDVRKFNNVLPVDIDPQIIGPVGKADPFQ